MRIAASVLLLLTLVPLASSAFAQPGVTSLALANTVILADASSEPVPVPQPSEKAMRYYRSGNVLWVVATLWGILVPAALLFTGASARLRDAARWIGRNWFFTLVLYSILFSLVTFVLDLPLAYYAGFVRQHAYDLSNQTAAKWWEDAFKGLAIGIVFSAATLWFPYLLLKRSPRRWWLYTGLLAAPFLAFTLLVTPVWIDPLFNDFGPMKDKQLESRILALADRAGIEGSRVYEVNKSVDTKTVNAYVAGFMNTKRIVLWDTILQKLSEREVLFVMGHEMGHYVLGHVLLIIPLASGLILFALYVIHRTAQGLIQRFEHRFGFRELSDPASLPLILLLFTLTFLVLTPVVLTVTRHNEHESDRFGLEITRDNRNCATAFAKLQQENLSNPRPGLLYKLWRSTHPPLGERIDFCNSYRPWETGGEMRYQDLIGN